MTISYPLSLPDTTSFMQVSWRGQNVVGVSESPFTLSQQVQSWAERWQGQVGLIPKKRADADLWIAFLLSLRGAYGTFLLGDPLRTAPRGTGGGTPLVDGASQTGYTLATKGWTFGAAVLKVGDHLSLGTGTTTRLHVNLKDVTADGAGLATLDLWPALRESPADAAALTLASPKGTFRLAENLSAWDVDAAKFHGIAFPIVEAL